LQTHARAAKDSQAAHAVALCLRDARDAVASRAVLIKPALLSYRLLAEIVKALIAGNTFLETELEKLRAAISPGYARGMPQRDRKD